MAAFRRCLLGLTLLAGCGGDDLVVPAEGAPHTVIVEAGEGQQGVVGEVLAESLAAQITDAVGRPVARVPVDLNLPDGGAVSPAALQTDDEGRIAVRWTLGPGAGPQLLELSAGTASTGKAAASFHATAAPGPASVVVVVGGDLQTGETGTALADSLTVQVTDSFGNPIAGAILDWSTATGTLTPAQSVTGGAGVAQSAWTLGGGAGAQSAQAALQADPGVAASFSAEATPGPPPILSLLVQPSDSANSGTPFVRQPVVQLRDAAGAPLASAGVPVTAAVGSGIATLGGTTTRTTDAAGQASYTDLSLTGAAGDYALIFAAPGFVSVASTPVTLGAMLPSPTHSSIQTVPGSVAAGGSSSIIVTVRDSLGNLLPGIQVTLTATGTGNTLTQPAAPTGKDGQATGALSSTVAGTKQVSATAGPVVLAAVGTVVVTPGPAVPATTDARVPNGKVLRLTTIVIQARDVFGNPLTTGGLAGQLAVSVTGTNSANPGVSDNGDGSYSASYLPFFKGTDTVAITLGGVPIAGSPYSSKVN